jgi:hypothetical protein
MGNENGIASMSRSFSVQYQFNFFCLVDHLHCSDFKWTFSGYFYIKTLQKNDKFQSGLSSLVNSTTTLSSTDVSVFHLSF